MYLTHHAARIALCLTLLTATVRGQNPSDETQAPKGPQVVTHTGTIKEIEKKGRATILTLTDSDGKDHEYPLTPKVRFEVQGTGDEGFIKAGQYVDGKGLLNNGDLLVNEVTVYLFPPGKKAPAGGYAKTPMATGEFVDSYQFGGTVIGLEPNKDYPNFKHLGLKVPARNVPPIMLEEGYQVKVVSLSPEHAAVGLPVEFDLQPLRGDRFNLARVIVTAAEPFVAEEVLKPAREK